MEKRIFEIWKNELMQKRSSTNNSYQHNQVAILLIYFLELFSGQLFRNFFSRDDFQLKVPFVVSRMNRTIVQGNDTSYRWPSGLAIAMMFNDERSSRASLVANLF